MRSQESNAEGNQGDIGSTVLDMMGSYQGTFKSLILVKFHMVPTVVISLLFCCPNGFKQLGQ